MFLGKMGEEDLLDVKNVKSKGNGLGLYVKNNIEPLLVAVKTSRTIAGRKQLTLKNSRKLNKIKNEWTEKRMDDQFARDMEGKDKNNHLEVDEKE